MNELPTYLLTSTKCPLPDHERYGSSADYLQEPEMAPDEPTTEDYKLYYTIDRHLFIAGMILGAFLMATVLVLWVAFFGGV